MKSLIFVLLLGAAIGLMWPTGKTATPAVAAPASASAASRETVLERSGSGHFYVDAEVNGQLVHFVVDTGATSVALTMEDARRIGVPFSTSEFQVVGTGASGEVRGKSITLDKVSVDGKEVRQVRGVVLEGLGVSLLGQTYLSRIGGVAMSGDRMRLQ